MSEQPDEGTEEQTEPQTEGAEAPEEETDEETDAEADADGDGPPDGSVDEVLAWVGDDPEKAQKALDAENESDKPRSTLVSQLEGLTDK